MRASDSYYFTPYHHNLPLKENTKFQTIENI